MLVLSIMVLLTPLTMYKTTIQPTIVTMALVSLEQQAMVLMAYSMV